MSFDKCSQRRINESGVFMTVVARASSSNVFFVSKLLPLRLRLRLRQAGLSNLADRHIMQIQHGKTSQLKGEANLIRDSVVTLQLYDSFFFNNDNNLIRLILEKNWKQDFRMKKRTTLIETNVRIRNCEISFIFTDEPFFLLDADFQIKLRCQRLAEDFVYQIVFLFIFVFQNPQRIKEWKGESVFPSGIITKESRSYFCKRRKRKS